MSIKTDNVPVSSGVEALIERLRDQGVERGRNEARRILDEAQEKAGDIIDKAKAEADEILRKARKEAEHLQHSGREALEVAARDTQLALKTQLSNRFAREVERLVSEELHSEELLRGMILEVAGRAARRIDPKDRMEVLLPRSVVALEELRKDPDEVSGGEVTRFVQALSEEVLRDGITFGTLEDGSGGLRLKLVDKAMTIELTDETVAGLLLEHLQPRFRALLEGIVK